MTDVNWLSPSMAAQMAQKIRHYWIGRGYLGIKTWIEPLAFVGPDVNGDKIGDKCKVIRSNIGPNGFPPRR